MSSFVPEDLLVAHARAWRRRIDDRQWAWPTINERPASLVRRAAARRRVRSPRAPPPACGGRLRASLVGTRSRTTCASAASYAVRQIVSASEEATVTLVP